MKTRTPRSTARRLYRGGCLLALLAMTVTAVALDKTTSVATKSGKSASRTKDSKAAEVARVAERAAKFRAMMEVKSSKRTAEVAILLRESMIARPYYSGGYSPYGGSTGTVSSGPLVVDSAKAELKTDPEQERDLVRADEFARQRKYELAIGFWQRVLDASTASVMTRDEWKYKGANHSYQQFRSIADEVERSIAKLPVQGLKTYRLQVDGNAQAMLAAGVGARREEALSNVVRKYFLSSIGDDAAFELACLSMDRGEFIGAARLLSKILSGYPDPSVSRGEILLRLAVAHSRLGDRKAAEEALVELRKDPPRGSRRLLAAIEADVRTAGRYVSIDDPESSTSWPMPLGGASRSGHMRAPAALRSKSNLTEFWSHEIDLGFNKPAVKTSQTDPLRRRSASVTISDGTSGTLILTESSGSGFTSYKTVVPYSGPSQRTGYAVGPSAAAGIEDVINRWKQRGWMPAGQVLLDGRRMYVKTLTDLVCLDTESKKLLWRSVRKNGFELDGMSQKFAQMGMLRNAGQPQNPLDVQLFADAIHQSMTLAGNLVLSIEGKSDDDPKSGGASKPAYTPPVHYYGPQVVHRKRNNWLSAYDALTGKRRWTRRAGDAKEESASEAGFLAAPVPYARLLLAPIITGGEIWLAAFDRETGKTVWKTNLCDEPSNGAAAWSPVGVSIDGGEAYVATGAGVVFAVDAMSGGVRWAFRYPRVGRANAGIQRRYGYYGGNTAQILDMEGMDEDVVIPNGKTLIVMASDYHEIFAIDRRTGEFLWDTPLRPNRADDEEPARYCLGVFGDSFYVASNRVVRRYKLRGGRLIWERKLENTTGSTPPSLGRGIVTDAAVYVPFKDSVLKLSHDDGKELDQYGVVLKDHQPVGNLYSDGQRLFVLGPGQISALGDIKARLEMLDKRVAKGDLDAQLERMDIRGRTNNRKGAIADLHAVLAQFLKAGRSADVPAVLLKAVANLEIAALDPVQTLRILTTYQEPVTKAANAQHLKNRNMLVRAALLRLLKTKQPGSVVAILRAGGLYGTRELFDVARQAIRKHAGGDDLTEFTAALTESVPSRRLAVMGLSRLRPPAVNAALRKTLKDPAEVVRLEAAVVLCNRGERDGLPVMVALLDSAEMRIRQRTASYLTRMTGKSFGYLAYEPAANRAKAAKQWRDWVRMEGKSASLRPVSPVRVFFGRTLISNQSNNFVEEYDEDGRRTQRITVANPTAVQGLPNGHRMVASAAELAVIEYDERWKEVGRISTSKYGMPYSVQRLDNGNTVVACYSAAGVRLGPSSTTNRGNVLEFNPKGEIKWRFQYAGMITHAERLENGNTLVSVYQSLVERTYGSSRFRSGRRTSIGMSLGKVLEVDPSRKVVRQIRGPSYPWSATRLPNGNTLVADVNQSRIIEIDQKDQIVWSKTGVSNARHAQRLTNGNTLVTHYNGVTEFDSEGRPVWNRVGSSTSGAVRY